MWTGIGLLVAAVLGACLLATVEHTRRIRAEGQAARSKGCHIAYRKGYENLHKVVEAQGLMIDENLRLLAIAADELAGARAKCLAAAAELDKRVEAFEGGVQDGGLEKDK